MAGVQLSVYDPSLTLIAHLPRVRNVQWTDEFNTAGAAQFDIPLYDDLLVAQPTLLNRRNVVVYRLGGVPVYAWQIIDLNPARVAADGEQWVSVRGLDVLNVLNAAKVAPEVPPLTDHTRDTRWFDQFSLTGDWYVSADWAAPAAVEQALSTSRVGYPLRWPAMFKHAKWLWSTNPDATAAVGWNHFRASFTLASQQDVKIYASADNIMDLRLNGVRIYNSTDRYQFRRTAVYTINLPAGTHRIGASVYNAGGPAGWLCAVANIDSAGNPTSAIYQSLSGNTLVHDDSPTRPGWAKAHVLKQLIVEAQGRGVHELVPVTFGFTATTDSAGAAWTDLTTRSEQVEVTLLSDVAAKFVEAGLDMKMTPVFTGTPGLRLDLWNSRGTDRSATVRLLAGLASASPTIASGRIRTSVTVRHDKGWAGEYTDSSVSTLRREIGLTAGGLQRDEDAAVLAASYLQENALEEVTIPVKITSEAGPQPYADFDVGDIVTTVGALSGTTAVRVMSISGHAGDDAIEYDVVGYPVT
jgi:hypothetical protein